MSTGMNQRLLLVVFDSFEVPGQGLGVLGTNSHFDGATAKDFARAVGSCVEVRSPDGQRTRHQVLGTEVVTSMWGQSNLAVLIEADSVEPQAEVWTI